MRAHTGSLSPLSDARAHTRSPRMWVCVCACAPVLLKGRLRCHRTNTPHHFQNTCTHTHAHMRGTHTPLLPLSTARRAAPLSASTPPFFSLPRRPYSPTPPACSHTFFLLARPRNLTYIPLPEPSHMGSPRTLHQRRSCAHPTHTRRCALGQQTRTPLPAKAGLGSALPPLSLFSLFHDTQHPPVLCVRRRPQRKKNPRGQCAQVCPPPALMILPTPQKSRSWPPPTQLALFLFSLLGFLPGCSLRSLFPKSLGPNLRGLLLCGFFFGLMSVNNSARRVSLARFSTSPFSRSKGRDTKKGKGSPRFLPFFHRWRRTRRPAHAHTHSTL